MDPWIEETKRAAKKFNKTNREWNKANREWMIKTNEQFTRTSHRGQRRGLFNQILDYFK
jgi:hypothetical protein